MPTISAFFGILVRMYYKEEHGVPHFHVEYQGRQATFTFDGIVLVGELGSRTANSLVREWASAHTVELEADWERARRGEPLERISPLD